MEPQLKAAKKCIDEGIFKEKKGTVWGCKIDELYYGVKYNATSIRVYPQ